MKFIVENWFVIVAIAAVGGSIGYAIYSFVKMPSDKQYLSDYIRPVP